jgi:hypothetical protein
VDEFRKGFETSSGDLLSGEDEEAKALEHEEQDKIAKRVPPANAEKK